MCQFYFVHPILLEILYITVIFSRPSYCYCGGLAQG